MCQEYISGDVQRVRASLSELPEPIANPFFIILSGLPGTGKSFFSGKLAERLHYATLSSDAMRKVLSPTPVYDVSESQRLFAALEVLAEDLLNKNIPVLLDATNLIERHRERSYRIADRLHVKLIIVRVEAPPETIQERLQSRTGDTELQKSSDADFEVYQKMKASSQKIRRPHFAVDTSRDITPVIEKIVREVRR